LVEARANPRELRQRAEVVDLGAGEAKLEKIGQGLLEPRRNDVLAILGQTADRKLERAPLGRLAGFEIAGRHGQLVQVGEQTGHSTSFWFPVWEAGILSPGRPSFAVPRRPSNPARRHLARYPVWRYSRRPAS